MSKMSRGKQIVVYTCNGILFRYKKEWHINTCYNIDEPQKHYGKWKKSDAKDHILYDSINMKYQ